MEFFKQLLSADFMPHGYCYLWDLRMVWLHVISDGLIALSYYFIPVVLIYFIRKNRDIPFNRVFWMFGTFILACGTTHLMEIWNIWHASYLLAGVLKAITAVVSVITAGMLIPLVPKVISLPGRMHLQDVNRKLEQEIAERKRPDAPIDNLLRRRVNVGFVAAVLLTILIGLSSWHGTRQAEQDAYWVSHTHEVIEAIQRTTRKVIEAETSARAFALTGQEPLLLRYQTDRDSIHEGEDTLRHMTADNPSQQRRLDVLGPQIGAALEFARQIIAKRRETQVYPGDSDALETDRLLNVVRATTQGMRDEEAGLLHQRIQTVGARQSRARIFALAGAFLAVGLWILARFAVNRDIAISERARAQVTTLNAELEQRVEQRTTALQSEVAERKRVEENLQEQTNVLDLAQVTVRDTKGRIILWSLGMERLYGYTREEAVGKVSHELLQTQFPESLAQIDKELDRFGTWEGELVHRKRDGSRMVVSSLWMLHRDAQGQPLRVMESNTDITGRRLAEEALKKSLATSEAALQEIADQKFALDQHAIVAVTDVQGTITYVNDKFCAISRYTKDELIGQNHRILNSGHHSKEFFQEMYHAIANGEVWHGEIKNRAKDGSIYWVDTTIVPFVDAEGKPRQYVAIRADITERKIAEEVRERLAAVVESSDDAIITQNMEGMITTWNAGAEKLFGYAPAEAVGRPMLILEPPERKNQALGMLTRVGRGERVEEVDTVRVRKDGKKIDISARIFPIKDTSGAIIGASKIARDITERKRADQEIQRLNNEMERRNTDLEAQTVELQKARDELEVRVNERTEELAGANQVLERSNIELQQFAYIASHDLQSPLRSISGFVQLLKSEYGGKLDQQADDWIRRTVQGIGQMQTMIRDVLAYSRVDSRSRPFTPTAFLDVFNDAVALLESSIHDAGGQVVCGELPVVMGDRSQLAQLMQNLIGNGLKYHGDKAPNVHVSAERDGNEWTFSVRDNGIGIDAKYHERIFEIFKRLHDQTEYPGTGIGLAVCRRVVSRHGGRIWLESEAGHGSVFHFTLPEGTDKN